MEFSVSLLNDLADPVINGVGLMGFKIRASAFLLASCSIPTIVFYYFPLSLLSVYRLVLWGWGLRTDGVYNNVYITLSQLALAISFNNNKN